MSKNLQVKRPKWWVVRHHWKWWWRYTIIHWKWKRRVHLTNFFRLTSDGTRLIPNLKTLYEFLEYNHFKMEIIQLVAHLIQPHCYMNSMDLKDAFTKWRNLKKTQKFYIGIFFFKFVVLPNGSSSGPWKFTKLTIPPIACLRIEGVIVEIYIDDIIVTGETYEE